MKRITLPICFVSILYFCGNAQPMDSAAMMKAWQNFMTPGDMQKMLAKSDGVWNEEVSTWMDPGQPPQKSMSTCTNKMVLNGLYQESVHKGTMMGMPFEGHGTVGYDNAKKVFVSSWIDNMGSGIMYTEGTWDNATKSLVMKGKTTDPMTGKDVGVREVMKFIDDNNQTMEMYGAGPDGKEMKMMEIKFTRKK
ncbi:MAG: DUF1579 domain-containing protein [Chitinophagales bacterium]